MKVLSSILSNGFVPLIPIFVWNLLLTKKLPPAYHPATFDEGIPKIILAFENGFRSVIFLMPLFIKLHITSGIGKIGFIIFIAGILVYFASWLLLINLPDSKWSTSPSGFTAPAWTQISFFIGLSLMGDSFYFGLNYSLWFLLIPSIVFSVFHICHSVLVWRRNYV